MTDVSTVHRDFSEFDRKAERILHVIRSEVKKYYKRYLRNPNAADTSAAAGERFRQYADSAVWFGATGSTLRGLIGAAFMKPANFEVPEGLQYLQGNVDGMGNGIDQQARRVLARNVGIGRHALYVDHPTTGGETSQADVAQNRSVIVSIDARNVKNWRVEKFGSEVKLSLVVIWDPAYKQTDDGFGEEEVERYRVLRYGVPESELEGLDEDQANAVANRYYIEIYTREEGDDWTVETITPTDSGGQNWDEIPFIFVGAENNDPEIDSAPMMDIADLNIAHFNNSATYEDSVWFCGQVQPYATGLDRAWVNMMEEKGMVIGSRVLLAFPEGAAFGYAQAEPNTLAGEAMAQKVELMNAIGARFLTPGSAPKTATEAQGDEEQEHSVLSLCAENVSQAYTKALEWAGRFMGATGDVKYQISQEFTRMRLDAPMMTALSALWNTGQLPKSDLWAKLRKSGIIAEDKTDEQIEEELRSNPPGLDLGEV